MQVVVTGAVELRAKFAALPARLRTGVGEATSEATKLEAEAIRADTPRLAGSLADSIQSSVSRTADGARGRIFSDLRYAPYVESGTRQHGVGRHMFDRGRIRAREPAEDVFRRAVDVVAKDFG